jgi:hypothetical protein
MELSITIPNLMERLDDMSTVESPQNDIIRFRTLRLWSARRNHFSGDFRAVRDHRFPTAESLLGEFSRCPRQQIPDESR